MLIAFAAFIGSRAIAALFAGRWHGNPRERSATLRAKTGLPPPYSAWQSSLSVTNWRSEEHTSELQSLMRISYAVFCLKKKKYRKHTMYTRENTHKYHNQ